MTEYIGCVGGEVVIADGQFVRPLPHLVRHSPTGFAWGYGGSGPAELARCLLINATGTEPEPAEYQQFKFDVIARLPLDQPWSLPQQRVLAWHRAYAEGRKQ